MNPDNAVYDPSTIPFLMHSYGGGCQPEYAESPTTKGSTVRVL